MHDVLFKSGFITEDLVVDPHAAVADCRHCRAARKLAGAGGQQASIQLVGERLRKMSLRAIGFLYHGLPRTSDPRDLMYSPLMSLDALDMIDLSRKGNPRERS